MKQEESTTLRSAGSNVEPLRIVAIFWVFLFLVFRRGIAYVGIPPLYAGEVTIAVFLLLWLRTDAIQGFLGNPFGRMALALAILPVCYLPFIDIDYDGIVEFFRNASVMYYVVFWFFGYAVAWDWTTQGAFIHGFYYAILASSLHVLMTAALPIEEISLEFNGTTFLGHHDSCYIYFSLGLGYGAIFFRQLGLIKSAVVIAVSLSCHVLHFERGSLLGIIAVIGILWWQYPIWFPSGKKVVAALAVVSAGGLAAFLFFDDPDAELVKNASLQSELFVATFGTSDALPDKEGTKDHRLRMWMEIVENTLEENALLGQGFSSPLIQESFRSPHNSFVTFFGRTGLLGLVLVVSLYFGFSARLLGRLGAAKASGSRSAWLLYVCFVPAFFSASLFGPTLEAPYSALVTNFIFGAALRFTELVSMTRAGFTTQGSEPWQHPN